MNIPIAVRITRSIQDNFRLSTWKLYILYAPNRYCARSRFMFHSVCNGSVYFTSTFSCFQLIIFTLSLSFYLSFSLSLSHSSSSHWVSVRFGFSFSMPFFLHCLRLLRFPFRECFHSHSEHSVGTINSEANRIRRRATKENIAESKRRRLAENNLVQCVKGQKRDRRYGRWSMVGWRQEKQERRGKTE